MAALPAAKKVVYQIEIICGNFFARLLGLLLEAAETLADVLDGGCVQVLLLDGHGVPLLHILSIFQRNRLYLSLSTSQLLFKTTLVLSDGLLKVLFFYLGKISASDNIWLKCSNAACHGLLIHE